MDEDTEFSLEDLQRCSYRYLQQVAKSLSLPSNVKKMYLVELIYAKKHRSEVDVQNIVQRVKLERQQLTQGNKKKGVRKMRLQGSEVTSTIRLSVSPLSFSPHHPVHHSPDLSHVQQTFKYKTKPTLLQRNSVSKSSDRVLRSFNLKSYQKPNYSLLNDSLLNLIKAPARESVVRPIKISTEESVTKVSVASRCLIKKYRPNILPRISNELVSSNRVTTPLSTRRPPPLSNITPMASRGPNSYVQSLGFRRADGKISKINAVVQKPKKLFNQPTDLKNVEEVTIQDIIYSNIETQTANSLPESSDETNNNYPVVSLLDMCDPEEETETVTSYYHKKIRAEQVRSRRMSLMEGGRSERLGLPKINDVFTQFSHISSSVTQPLYVQVSEESERIHNYPVIVARSNTTMLESFYNFKNQFLMNQPLLQVATTTNTTCVYSTPLIATAVEQPGSGCGDNYCVSLSERDDICPTINEEVMGMCDFLKLAEQDMTLRKYHEEFSSPSSVQTHQSQELSNSATIPEMVEDALEIISQDGDYMERIGMDVRMQCILCSYAGPKAIMECHIRREHHSEVTKLDKNEWNVSYKLGSLAQTEVWSSHVAEFRDTLYALSVKYEDPDCFMAALATISDGEPKKGSITLYNKVTGEPYSWQGEIETISSNMPYYNDTNFLKLELSRLDLLPNSANLKLLNRELVIKSPTKVVVGQPELNDIHIILFVKFD